MKILVTGAAGLVGRAVAVALADAGHRVRAMRHRADAGPGHETVVASLEDEAALRAALAGVDAVVHAAALMGGDPERLRQVNVQGSERLFRLAREGGVGPVVYVSTAGVYSADDPVDMDEDHAIGSEFDYCRTKHEAEVVGRALLGEQLTVLRPVTVYRTSRCPLLVALVNLVGSGAPMPHNGGADSPVDVVHADDLAAAAVAAVAGRGRGGTFNIAGPEQPGFRALVTAVADRLGVEPNWQPVDSGAVFEQTALVAVTVPRTVSIARARRELGYRPRRRWVEEIAALRREDFV